MLRRIPVSRPPPLWAAWTTIPRLHRARLSLPAPSFRGARLPGHWGWLAVLGGEGGLPVLRARGEAGRKHRNLRRHYWQIVLNAHKEIGWCDVGLQWNLRK